MLSAPFYDPLKSYEENYAEGPFNGFADGIIVSSSGSPRFNFHGIPVNYPLGIPAGPLLNSAFCIAAFKKGFDIAVYKTVRSDVFPCHPFPNVLAIHPEGDLTFDKLAYPVIADTEYTEPLSITNSFGVPSKDAGVWQEDVKKSDRCRWRGAGFSTEFHGNCKTGAEPARIHR